jgi:hypothetical protein
MIAAEVLAWGGELVREPTPEVLQAIAEAGA